MSAPSADPIKVGILYWDVVGRVDKPSSADPIKVGILYSLSGIMAVMPSAPATPDAWTTARG